MQVYLDESGDTGWNFLSLIALEVQAAFYVYRFFSSPKHTEKCHNKSWPTCTKKYEWKSERKACHSSENQKLEFCAATNQMLLQASDIKIDCIVAKKENVQSHIRADGNKLCNYMCKLVMIDHVKHVPEFEFIPDKRSVKVESGNSLSDYLQTVLWFECSTNTTIVNNPQESHKNYNLQFIDWVANCVWSHFENGETNVYRELSRHIKVRPLYS